MCGHYTWNNGVSGRGDVGFDIHPELRDAVTKTETDIKVLINQNLAAVGRTEATTAFTDGCSGLRRILAGAGVTDLPFLTGFTSASDFST